MRSLVEILNIFLLSYLGHGVSVFLGSDSLSLKTFFSRKGHVWVLLLATWSCANVIVLAQSVLYFRIQRIIIHHKHSEKYRTCVLKRVTNHSRYTLAKSPSTTPLRLITKVLAANNKALFTYTHAQKESRPYSTHYIYIYCKPVRFALLGITSLGICSKKTDLDTTIANLSNY